MKPVLIILVTALSLCTATAYAKILHKWNVQEYGKGKFVIQRENYPKTEETTPPEDKVNTSWTDGYVKIDFKGRIQRHPQSNQNSVIPPQTPSQNATHPKK